MVIDWNHHAPKVTTIIPITISFMYKLVIDGFITLKARCSIRGYLMPTGAHYYPYQFQFPIVEKATSLILFYIAAIHGWPIEHIDIQNAHVHEVVSSPNHICFR